jgi:hypothetical protein
MDKYDGYNLFWLPKTYMDETNIVAPKFGLKIFQLSKIDYTQITYLRL